MRSITLTIAILSAGACGADNRPSFARPTGASFDGDLGACCIHNGRVECRSHGPSIRCDRLGDEGSTVACGAAMDPSSAETRLVEMALPDSASSVSLGRWHACAVARGRVYCWGQNGSGQLGNNGGPAGCSPRLVSLLAGPQVTVVTGDAHTCALAEDGTVSCWGSNVAGVLGRPQGAFASYVPQPVAIPSIRVLAGSKSTVCGVSVGELYCWGWLGFPWIAHDHRSLIATEVPVVASCSERCGEPLVGDGAQCTLGDGILRCWDGGSSRCRDWGGGWTVDGRLEVGSEVRVDPRRPREASCLMGSTLCTVVADHTLRCGRTIIAGAGFAGVACGDSFVCAYGTSLTCFGEDGESVGAVLEVGEPIVGASVSQGAACVLTEGGRVLCTGWAAPSVLDRDTIEPGGTE